MNDMSPNKAEREAKLEGMGCKRKRVEDARFTQGKGNYVDDIKLPGMLFGDFVRSPHAHARIKGINIKKAMKVPGVLAVLTLNRTEGRESGMDADAGRRRANGSRRRKGPVPESGGRLCGGHGPLCRGRRCGSR